MNKILAIGAVALFGLTAYAAAGDGTVTTVTRYVGGHDPGRAVQVVAVPESTTPYALTGNAAPKQYEPIRIGSRVVGYREVK